LNGSLGTNAGIENRYNGNVRLNYNPGDYNLFCSYSLRKDNRNRTSSDAREQLDSLNSPQYYRDNNRSFAPPISHMAALGTEIKLDERSTIGISGDFFYNTLTRTDLSSQILLNSASVPIADNDRNRIDYETEKEFSTTVFFDHAFPDEDHSLRSEYKYSSMNEVEDSRYTNIFRVPAAPLQYDNLVITQREKRNDLSVEYTNPLTKDTKIEAGYTGEFCNTELENAASEFDRSRSVYMKDLTKSNRFLYNDAINALYATIEHSFEEFGVLAGLRAETAFLRSNLVTLDSVISNSYFNLFPTLHLSYKYSEAAELQLNYSRRTRRPEGDDLNPFPEYHDSRNLSSGNPKLLPEYIHSIELGCKLEKDEFSVMPSLYYRYTYNRFTSITKVLKDTLLLTTRTNLSTDQSAGVETILSGSVNEMLTAHASVNVFYNQIDASNLGYSRNKSVFTWSGAMTCNLNVTKATMLQLNSNYTSARLTPQGKMFPSYVVNMGIRQELFEKKVSLIFTVADIFKTLQRKMELNTPALKQTTINTRDSRIIYLGFVYHFGNPPNKSKDDALKYDDSL
jgi:outer membrane receptor protein involved in Fe transport